MTACVTWTFFGVTVWLKKSVRMHSLHTFVLVFIPDQQEGMGWEKIDESQHQVWSMKLGWTARGLKERDMYLEIHGRPRVIMREFSEPSLIERRGRGFQAEFNGLNMIIIGYASMHMSWEQEKSLSLEPKHDCQGNTVILYPQTREQEQDG